VSESIAPENGGDAGGEKPAPPQLVVPAVVVYLSDRPLRVVVVALDVVDVVVVVGAALVVVVLAAPVVEVVAAPVVEVVAAPVVEVVAALVVVVGAPPVVEVRAAPVVVVGAAPVVEVLAPVVEVGAAPVVVVVEDRQGLCAQETEPRDVPPCLVQLSCVNCPHAGAPFWRKQQATLFVGFAA